MKYNFEKVTDYNLIGPALSTINLEENKIKIIDEELKRIDTLEQAFNREL